MYLLKGNGFSRLRLRNEQSRFRVMCGRFTHPVELTVWNKDKAGATDLPVISSPPVRQRAV